jgi:hypothetical protein
MIPSPYFYAVLHTITPSAFYSFLRICRYSAIHGSHMLPLPLNLAKDQKGPKDQKTLLALHWSVVIFFAPVDRPLLRRSPKRYHRSHFTDRLAFLHALWLCASVNCSGNFLDKHRLYTLMFPSGRPLYQLHLKTPCRWWSCRFDSSAWYVWLNSHGWSIFLACYLRKKVIGIVMLEVDSQPYDDCRDLNISFSESSTRTRPTALIVTGYVYA